MALLSRVADRIYWAARYLERAEDTARLVRAFQEVFADLPLSSEDGGARWAPLMVVAGVPGGVPSDADEHEVVRFLVTDRSRPGSVVGSVAAARENLRTTREVLPREAWQALNDLWLYVDREAERAAERRFRDRFLGRVIDDSRRLDGVLTSTMTRDAAWEMWRLGRYLERADMTTRVVGVRAAALMAYYPTGRPEYDEVQWMGVLRSISALQMFQRAVHGSISGVDVVRFLLYDRRFPRSVASALDEIDASLGRLRRSEVVRERVAEAFSVLRSTTPSVIDGSNLDSAMERVQIALATIDVAITNRYLRLDGD
jgi:uncharacterized alpha-E superfamily protein